MSGQWDFGNDGDFKYLAMSPQKRMEVIGAPYDPKKDVYIPHKEHAFLEATIESTTGDDATCKDRFGNTVTVKKDLILVKNPSKFTMCEDMSGMTNLNEGTVLGTLRDRFMNSFLYTYSGLFCICVNPFVRLPIYTQNVVDKYKGKRRTEMPPHLFSIADNAYTFMLQDRENQAILITGESGAGKTENTKKVISYFAMVTASKDAPAEGAEKKVGLEEQIMQANPVLEAYGNAKTVRNNNSSRFGKFVRIHFGPSGKIAGADVETYLLEKSRVTYQLPGIERNYHIFYWLLSDGLPEYREMILLQPDPALYFYVNQGCLTVDNMDDKKELVDTDAAFGVLGFTEDEKRAVYKCTGAIVNLGEMKFKQKGKEEQAEADGTAEAEKVANSMGINCADFLKSLMSPKVKVGNDFVTKAQNVGQVNFTVSALSKCIFAKLFSYLVLIVNRSLDTKQMRQYYIGVLDIAGFEIFVLNVLEQLLINYTNERLQQFFNHVMFVLEQEEYKKEGIVWESINFGMDLQITIELIEKPMGILDILQEQCLFPKATDESFIGKLKDQHLGKNPKFDKWKPVKGAKHEAHFTIAHYAGTVAYNISGWLFKNKDPVNDSVISVMQSSKTPLICGFFAPDPDEGQKKKKKAPQTISAAHKASLISLVNNLKTTHPHFVRCLIPNEVKKPLIMESPLVLHQLKCNGVLEGIRICRKGFPNRMLYPEFKQRYSILAPNAIPQGFVEAKDASGKVLAAIEGFDQDNYRLGNTKVFFKAGVLGQLEEIRDDRLGAIIKLLQAWIRGYILRRNYNKLCDQRIALATIQRNLRGWLSFKSWTWWKLLLLIKPLLSASKAEDEMKMKEEEAKKVADAFEKLKVEYKELQDFSVNTKKKLDDLQKSMGSTTTQIDDLENTVDRMTQEKLEADARIKETEELLEKEEKKCEGLELAQQDLEGKISGLKKDIEGLKGDIGGKDKEGAAKDKKIEGLQADIVMRDDDISKLNKEKSALQANLKKTEEALAGEEQKVAALVKVKQNLESNISDLEDSLNREKKVRADVEKAKRKVETELKASRDACAELENIKKELEDTIKKKESDINGLNSNLEEANSTIAKLNKKIKELQRRIEELEEELEAERGNRSKVEKQRNDLSRDLDELASRLDDASGQASAAADMNKKRESEVAKLKRDMEQAALASDSALQGLKKKTQDQINELSEQVDALNKGKQKAEKERNALKNEADDLAGQLESVKKAKANAERAAKGIDAQLQEANSKLEEASRNAGDFGSQKNKLAAQNAELQRAVEEAESNANNLAKTKTKLQRELEEAKAAAEEEGRNRQKFQGEARNLQADLDAAREQLEEEAEAHAAASRSLQKAQADAAEWKRKCDSGEGGGMGGPEFDDFKRKMNTKLHDAQSAAESAQNKCASVEKQKQRLASEMEDLVIEVERAQSAATAAEKRGRQFDKVIEEWKGKVAGIGGELESANKEARANAAEVFKLRAQVDESHDTVEALRRENKNLSDEIHDLTDQLSEGGRSVHELEKARRRLEMEKEELQSALEEAEAALEQEEAKVSRAQLEIATIRQDIDRRLAEKDEEFEAVRKNHSRALESVQASLESEARGKQEALRLKKKLEGDINELEVALDSANRGRGEAEKVMKKLQQQIRDMEGGAGDAARERDDAREQVAASERRANVLAGEIEELRTQLEAAERARKAAEGELHEAADRVSELSTATASMQASKRKLENDIQSMQSDLEDQGAELRASEETAKKAMSDAARLAEELRQEQEHAGHIEKMRRAMEAQVKELQGRLDEAEASAMKGGKRMIQKLEQRIRELEVELDNEQRRHGETTKSMRKQERRLKELAFQADEDRKNQEKMQDMIDKLQNKIKTYKRQVEEAEEIAAVNLAKYRKVQHELEDAEERADMAENTLGKLRTKARGSSQAKGE